MLLFIPLLHIVIDRVSYWSLQAKAECRDEVMDERTFPSICYIAEIRP